MTDDGPSSATTGRFAGAGLGRAAMALLVLLLAFAPRASLAAAFSARDSDAIGAWAGDAKDPASRFEVTAGSHPGELKLISPAALKVPPIMLHRIATDAFATASGAEPVARLTLTAARHAHLSIHGSNDKRIMFSYLLLDKQ